MIFAFILISIAIFAIYWGWIAHNSAFLGNWNQIRSPVVIFDFDGTICPSYPLFIEQVNVLVKKINKDEDFRNMDIREIMRNLRISYFRLPFLLRKARRNVQNQILELSPIPNIEDVLLQLKKDKVTLGILTSNSMKNVVLYLKKHRINLFDFIYTANNVFGKNRHLKIILEKSGVDPKDVIYIGDELRDIEAAKKASIESVAVAWGYNHSSVLEKMCPTALCSSIPELVNVINALISK